MLHSQALGVVASGSLTPMCFPATVVHGRGLSAGLGSTLPPQWLGGLGQGKRGPPEVDALGSEIKATAFTPASQLHASGPEWPGAPSGRQGPLSPPFPPIFFPWGLSHYCVPLTNPYLGPRGNLSRGFRMGKKGWTGETRGLQAGGKERAPGPSCSLGQSFNHETCLLRPGSFMYSHWHLANMYWLVWWASPWPGVGGYSMAPQASAGCSLWGGQGSCTVLTTGAAAPQGWSASTSYFPVSGLPNPFLAHTSHKEGEGVPRGRARETQP